MRCAFRLHERVSRIHRMALTLMTGAESYPLQGEPMAQVGDGSLIPSRFDADVDRHVHRDVEERAVFIDRGDAHADRWTSASSSI